MTLKPFLAGSKQTHYPTILSSFFFSRNHSGVLCCSSPLAPCWGRGGGGGGEGLLRNAPHGRQWLPALFQHAPVTNQIRQYKGNWGGLLSLELLPRLCPHSPASYSVYHSALGGSRRGAGALARSSTCCARRGSGTVRWPVNGRCAVCSDRGQSADLPGICGGSLQGR